MWHLYDPINLILCFVQICKCSYCIMYCKSSLGCLILNAGCKQSFSPGHGWSAAPRRCKHSYCLLPPLLGETAQSELRTHPEQLTPGINKQRGCHSVHPSPQCAASSLYGQTVKICKSELSEGFDWISG